MQFSDSSTLNGIVQDVRFLSSTDANGYATADIVRNANRWYERAIAWLLESEDDWDWDDTNLTNLPRADAAMVANQEDYGLPSDLFKLLRLEATWDGATYYKAYPLHFSERAGGSDTTTINNEFQRTRPFFQLFANQILIRPIPTTADVAAGASLRIWYARNFDDFVAADTTQVPGFVKLWHRLISYGAAYDFAISRNKNNVNQLRQELAIMEKEFRAFYQNKNKDRTWMLGANLANYR